LAKRMQQRLGRLVLGENSASIFTTTGFPDLRWSTMLQESTDRYSDPATIALSFPFLRTKNRMADYLDNLETYFDRNSKIRVQILFDYCESRIRLTCDWDPKTKCNDRNPQRHCTGNFRQIYFECFRIFLISFWGVLSRTGMRF
jgi:hypothetical protein